MKRYDIINYLIEKNNYNNYLEIGIENGETFQYINIKFKEGVDPRSNYPATYQMTSDDFFESIMPLRNYKYDIIFIDGMHTFDQSYRDLMNSLNYLSDNGTIVMHDCHPQTELEQIVPRRPEAFAWLGDVWKTILKIRNENKNLNVRVVDTDYGCGIIRNSDNEKLYIDENIKYDYKYYLKNKDIFLNLISIEKFKNLY